MVFRVDAILVAGLRIYTRVFVVSGVVLSRQ